MKKKIKIAYFTDVLEQGLDGVTHTLFNIIERIPDEKFDVRFVTPLPPKDIDLFPYPIFRCKYIKVPFYRDYRIASLMFDKSLKAFLDDFQPDLIHFTTPSLLGKYAVEYAEENNLKLTTTYHTHFISYIDYYLKYAPGISHLTKHFANKMMQWFYSKCDLTFVPSLPLLNELKKLGISSEKLYLWARGINIEQFNPGRKDKKSIREMTGNNDKNLLYVGRIVWEKDIKLLIDIYKHYEQRGKKVNLIITGEGPQRKILQKKMPNAIFTGKLRGKELARMFASCDVFVFPSTTETFGNVVLEAMASGIPTVVSSKGGQVGFVKDQHSGLIARAKDPMDFVRKIDKLLQDANLNAKIKRNARIYAQSQSWDALAERLFMKYDMISEESEKTSVNEFAFSH